MRKLILSMGILLFLVACGKESNKIIVVDKYNANHVSQIDLENHTSNRIMNWEGVYEGVLPCASCPGIETTLELKSDQTFELTSFYRDSNMDEVVQKGTFDWQKKGNQVTLNNDDNYQLRIEKNQVRFLDSEGQVVVGDLEKYYILDKVK